MIKSPLEVIGEVNSSREAFDSDRVLAVENERVGRRPGLYLDETAVEPEVIKLNETAKEVEAVGAEGKKPYIAAKEETVDDFVNNFNAFVN